MKFQTTTIASFFLIVLLFSSCQVLNLASSDVLEARRVYKDNIVPAGPMDTEESYDKLMALKDASDNQDDYTTTESFLDMSEKDFEAVLNMEETTRMEALAREQAKDAASMRSQGANEDEIRIVERQKQEKRSDYADKVVEARRKAQEAKIAAEQGIVITNNN